MDKDQTLHSSLLGLTTGQTLGHYRIFQYLGKGGMGVVWKAEDLRLKRLVALKFLPDVRRASPDAQSRFQIEAQAAASLDHPSICSIYEIDQVDGLWFIAMAFVEGENLSQKIERGPIPIDEILNLTIQAAEGLETAHARNIVHRDIKSLNMMVTPRGQLKILDFGLAQIEGVNSLTADGATVGTPSYMSPEQAKGSRVDHRTDIWSLGVVLWEMIARHLPFGGSSTYAIIRSIIDDNLPRLTRFRPDVPPNLEAIAAKALAKSVADRYRNATELLADLRGLREGRPLAVARAAGTSYSSVSAQAPVAIAVLPFVNLSSDPENEYFSDGLTEELINALAQLEGIRVTSRSSAFTFKGKSEHVSKVGEILRVSSVLEGSVRKAGNKVRITVQLVQVSDGFQMWSQRYDVELKDVFEVQEEIARSVVSGLHLKLLSDRQVIPLDRYTGNVHVYNSYLQGIHHLRQHNPASFERAKGYFEEALAQDPNYAPAYAGIGEYYSILGFYNILPPKEVLPKALKAVLTAMELDSQLPEAHATFGEVTLILEWDWDRAEKEFVKAIQARPRDAGLRYPYGRLLSKLKRFDEALEQYTTALETDPLSRHLHSSLAFLYYYMGDYNKAVQSCDKTLELDANYAEVHYCLALIRMDQQRFPEATTLLEKVAQLTGNSLLAQTGLMQVQALSGDREGALKCLEELIATSAQAYVSPGYVAFVYVALGDFEKTLEYLEKGYEARDSMLLYLKTLKHFDPLRSDPRFISLMERVGLGSKRESKT